MMKRERVGRLGFNELRGIARTENEDSFAVAIPLLDVPVRGQGIDSDV